MWYIHFPHSCVNYIESMNELLIYIRTPSERRLYIDFSLLCTEDSVLTMNCCISNSQQPIHDRNLGVQYTHIYGWYLKQQVKLKSNLYTCNGCKF